MSRKRIGQFQQSNYNSDYDSFFSIWQNSNFNQKNEYQRHENYFDNNSIFGSQPFSMKSSFKDSSMIHQNKEADSINLRVTPQDTISLTDMLKTNCSHQQISGIGRVQGFDKLSHPSKQINIQLQQQYLNNHDLMPVSNRKLQNKANSKRARQRRKQQWNQLKLLVEDLQSQNNLLKQRMRKNNNQQNKNSQIVKNWRYCKKCRKQIFDESSKTIIQSKTIKNKINNEVDNRKIYVQNKRYLVQTQEKKCYQKYDSMASQKSMQNSRDYQKQFDNLEPEFQQFNFDQIQVKKRPQTKNIRNNWTGKIWIALSILMLTIGLQLYGLDGDSQKYMIRVNQKQAKLWADDYRNNQITQFKIKMKMKMPFQFIQNQKQAQSAKFKKQKTKEKWKSEDKSKFMKQHQSRFDGVSFESQQSYAQQLLDEEESEFQINKDLLFSIHAQIDDIGRYI